MNPILPLGQRRPDKAPRCSDKELEDKEFEDRELSALGSRVLPIFALLVLALFQLPALSMANQDSSSGNSADGQATSQTEPAANQSGVEESGAKSSSSTQSAPSTSLASAEESADEFDVVTYPLIVLGIGIAVVLGLIILFKFNAFIALIIAALVVSFLAPGDIGSKVSRVAGSFGSSAGGIAIVIALAAVIGKCMLDSGAADRIVRMFLGLLGEKRAPMALMGSGFVLAVPVFFDTVFYLLVPLARSLHRKTGKQYLTYIMAIAAGGAITHTLVPPTPGPLLMAANLGIDVGKMILIGAMVALPSAIVGLYFAKMCDRFMKTPMRDLPGRPEPKPLEDHQLPSLWLSLAPVVLPVLLISASTIATTIADSKQAALFQQTDVTDWQGFQQRIRTDGASADATVGKRLLDNPHFAGVRESLISDASVDDQARADTIAALNRVLRDKKFYDANAFLGIPVDAGVRSKAESDLTRQKPVDTERMNRQLLESAYPDLIAKHDWNLPSRRIANVFKTLGDANLALLISALIAMATLMIQRGMTLRELGMVVEESLMSGGVIILITAAGGAFGAMLQKAAIGEAIQQLFAGSGEGLSGMYAYLTLGFVIASVLKVAQGSSTVAMIVGSAMMAAIIGGNPIGCSYVYLATSIGAGSLVGSWMNDSGFWIFAKMGGLTEVEALKSWTILLVALGLTSFAVTLLLATFLPLS